MSYKYDPYTDSFTHIDNEGSITAYGTGTEPRIPVYNYQAVHLSDECVEKIAKAFRDQYEKGYEDGKRYAEGKVIQCKDCRKHNRDDCPLVAYRGKAQGHEYDYQYCVFGERKDE